MPISLRLPADIESQIAGYSARAGVSKSALIVRSIQEFLARHTQRSSLQIYEEAMHAAERRERQSRPAAGGSGSAGADGADGADGAVGDAQREVAEQRPHKLQIREALRRKHAARSARASEALAQASSKARGKARGTSRKAA